VANIVSFDLRSGYEYAVEATMGGYGPVEKRYHLSRRRRWVRLRRLVKPAQQSTSQVSDVIDDVVARKAIDTKETNADCRELFQSALKITQTISSV
jgi:hypothetical protein